MAKGVRIEGDDDQVKKLKNKKEIENKKDVSCETSCVTLAKKIKE